MMNSQCHDTAILSGYMLLRGGTTASRDTRAALSLQIQNTIVKSSVCWSTIKVDYCLSTVKVDYCFDILWSKTALTD